MQVVESLKPKLFPLGIFPQPHNPERNPCTMLIRRATTKTSCFTEARRTGPEMRQKSIRTGVGPPLPSDAPKVYLTEHRTPSTPQTKERGRTPRNRACTMLSTAADDDGVCTRHSFAHSKEMNNKLHKNGFQERQDASNSCRCI